MTKIVCSMTTIPNRLNDSKLENTLKSLTNQSRKFDVIYLTLPQFSRRLNKPYPRPPDNIKQYCQIVYCNLDYGPITKIMGGLLMEKDPETIIITCDDDVIYPMTLVEELLKQHQKYPHSAIGSAGFNIGTFPFYISVAMNQKKNRNKWWFNMEINDGMLIDVLCGYAGVLYLRKFFPNSLEEITRGLLQYPMKDKNVFLHDDIMLSSYLNSKDIPRRLTIVSDVSNDVNMNYGLSNDMLIFSTTFLKAIYKCYHWNLIKRRQSYNLLRCITTPIIILLVVIIIVVIIYVIKN